MTTQRTFNKLKKTNQKTKDIVFGYNRRRGKQFKKQIPEIINYLCLAYYYIYNKLDLSNIDTNFVQLLNGNTLLWTKKDFELILPINGENTQWTFQISKLCPTIANKIMMIGIADNETYWYNTYAMKKDLKYGFDWSTANKIKKYTRYKRPLPRSAKKKYRTIATVAKYGKQCDVGDIVTMTLDQRNHELKFKINDKDYGAAWDIPCRTYSILILGAAGLSITLSDV